MGLRSSLMSLERRYAWGLLGFLSGTLLSAAGLYFGLHERRPSVSVQVASQFDILDVRQPLQDLSILFQGNDIQRANQNLRTLHVRFANDGDADLLQSQYDQSGAWGLNLRGGRILKVQLLDASSAYLRANLNPQLVGDTTVTLNKVIFERGRQFTLDLLVLHAKNTQPTLSVTGKIVGSDSIPVRAASSPETQRSVWSRAVTGSLWTQVIRLFVYFAAALVSVLIATGIGAGVSSLLTSRARRVRAKEIRLVLDTTSPEEVLARDVLEHIYSVAGADGLTAVRRIIKNGRLSLEDIFSVDALADRSDRHHAAISEGQLLPVNGYGPMGDPSLVLGSDEPQSPFFASYIDQLLAKARLLDRKPGSRRVHPAFEKLLSQALAKLTVPEVEQPADEA